MSADSNMGFHQDSVLASALNRHAITFQSGAVNSSSATIPLANSVGLNSTTGMMWGGSSSMINNTPGVISPGNSGSSNPYDSVSGLKQDAGFAVEWSIEEQNRLKEGLVKYSHEPNIMRYIKIAATLRDKTVRDVALRCRWMMNEGGKRRKQESYSGRKMKDKKETLVESSSKASIPPILPSNMATYSFQLQHLEPNDRFSSEVPALSGTTRHLLDENAKVFGQITANLAMFRIQDNIDLLCRTRNNIRAILNDMREMPGIMSQMPTLPISINEELAATILPGASQAMMFGSPGAIHMKQEPRCS